MMGKTKGPSLKFAVQHPWLGFNDFPTSDDLKLSLNHLLGDPAGPPSDQGRLFACMQNIF